ncbi:hypothetical protein NPIL_650581 [Nephila pilipes]|uniref:Secreted protein n=1 Tax=Nephila pilipes TaxID=299642 RepID=A0A8X6UFE5_NEPPI|nr:hypothetical protein NPIL_650581 [Nephila pilipes]
MKNEPKWEKWFCSILFAFLSSQTRTQEQTAHCPLPSFILFGKLSSGAPLLSVEGNIAKCLAKQKKDWSVLLHSFLLTSVSSKAKTSFEAKLQTF